MIVHYFANNPKDNPITLTIASIFSLFTKILTYHYLTDKSKNNVASVLKINPFFVKDYETAAIKYNVSKTVQIISLLRTYDMKSKGFGDVSTEPGDLLKELVYKILHCEFCTLVDELSNSSPVIPENQPTFCIYS